VADRPYVKHGARSGRLAPLVGVAFALGIVAVLTWGLTGAVRGSGQSPPPPPTQAGPPPKPVLKIIFPEGFTRKEMAKRIAAVNVIAKRKRNVTPRLSPRAYLRLTQRAKLPPGFAGARPPHLEGFLFPATYDFTEDTSSRALVRKQLEAFQQAWDEIDLRYARSKNLTAYEVLIIASMVEEEVQVPRERPLAAAVIYNRLRLRMPLQIDATIRYGLDIAPTEPIHQSELESDSPYNTRMLPGLPPTPISNPGLAAMQAAAHPANVDYLYYIRKPDCKSHFFTASEQEFLNYTRAGLHC
jgi:UPF0755 protein